MPSVWSFARFRGLPSPGVHAGFVNPTNAPLPASVALSTLRTMRLPPALGAGARVALVAPAGPLRSPHEPAPAAAQAESLGWEPVMGLHVSRHTGYLAGTDAERLADLNA